MVTIPTMSELALFSINAITIGSEPFLAAYINQILYILIF